MRNVLSVLFVSLVSTSALWAANQGDKSFEQSTETYSCWAQTTCANEQTISCSASGTEGCHWEARDEEYVLCQGFNIDGTNTQSYITCPN